MAKVIKISHTLSEVWDIYVLLFMNERLRRCYHFHHIVHITIVNLEYRSSFYLLYYNNV